MDGVKVFAPASVANIAVGYDILGLALDQPGDDVIINEGNTPGIKITEIRGAKGKLPYEIEKNTAGYSAMRLLQHLGKTDLPIHMEIHKKMKLGTGMGSSAASAVAGVYGINEYLGCPLSKAELLRFAVEGEQIADGAFHADNVAPSLLGGLVLIRDNDSLDFKKIHVPQGLCVTMIYPHIKILTRDSRAVLKETVPLSTVIKQTGNLASFIAGMFTSDFDLIRKSLQDLMIEPQRAHLIPYFYEIKNNALNHGALGFSISGAGPSMFALCQNTIDAENILNSSLALLKDRNVKCDCFISNINLEGAYKY